MGLSPEECVTILSHTPLCPVCLQPISTRTLICWDCWDSGGQEAILQLTRAKMEKKALAPTDDELIAECRKVVKAWNLRVNAEPKRRGSR